MSIEIRRIQRHRGDIVLSAVHFVDDRPVSSSCEPIILRGETEDQIYSLIGAARESRTRPALHESIFSPAPVTVTVSEIEPKPVVTPDDGLPVTEASPVPVSLPETAPEPQPKSLKKPPVTGRKDLTQ